MYILRLVIAKILISTYKVKFIPRITGRLCQMIKDLQKINSSEMIIKVNDHGIPLIKNGSSRLLTTDKTERKCMMFNYISLFLTS